MIKEQKRFFLGILFLIDLSLVSLAWIASYYLRFYGGIIPVYREIPPFSLYLRFLVVILVIWAIVFRFSDFYQPKRTSSLLKETASIIKASSFFFLALILITFFAQREVFSRIVLLLFWVLSNLLLFLFHLFYRKFWHWLHRKGYNIRYALIVGSGELAKDLAQKLESHPELGFKIVGFLADKEEERVLGNYADIQKVIKEKGIDSVFIALPFEKYSEVKSLLENLGDEIVNVRLVPDIYQFITLRGGIEEFDGLSFITLRDTPIYGWNAIAKRSFDITLSFIIFVLFSPLFLLISIAVKLSSRGSVFYKQERMGLDGKSFQMLKFRTMAQEAEIETGPIWAKKDDPRRTRLGGFLRRISLDEFPQLFNVLKGEMSLVGPRPERPVFVEEFRKSIPKYILRHKVKAGITGWAQVNGLRGNTDLKKRIEYDLYYIENWSLLFDLKILTLTIGEILFSRHAY